MSNLFFYSPKKPGDQKAPTGSGFFAGNQAMFNEDDDLNQDDEEFDDDKNDETFGDSGPIGNDWKAKTTGEDAIAQYKSLKQSPIQKMALPPSSNYDSNDFGEDPEMLNSVLHQAIDDNEDEESFVMPQQPSGQFFLGLNQNNPWGAPAQKSPLQQQVPPQHQSPYHHLHQQQPSPQQQQHHIGSPMQRSPMQHTLPQPAQQQAPVSAEDFEALLLQSFSKPAAVPQQQPTIAPIVGSPTQKFAPVSPQQPIASPQHQQPMTPPRQQTPPQQAPITPTNTQPIQILRRQTPPPAAVNQQPSPQQQQQPATPPQQKPYHHHHYNNNNQNPLMQAFSSPEKKLGPVYNTYLLPNVQQGKNAPTYGYFPIYRKVFHDAEYMPADLIEDIVRQQMADLEITNPFLDDYYYCVQLNNKHQSKRIPPNFVQWVEAPLIESKPEAGAEQQQQVQLPRVFGRIPSNNVRAPRMLMQMDKNDLSELTGSNEGGISKASLHKDAAVGVQMAIENGFSQLLIVEDANLCLRLGNGDNNGLLNQKLQQACLVVLDTFQLSFEKIGGSKQVTVIASRAKGLKYLSKTLRIMPEPYSVLLIQTCILNWAGLLRVLATHDDVLQKQFFKDLCQAISYLSITALCPILNCIVVNNNAQQQQQQDKIWMSIEGRRVLSVLLNKGFELNKKEKMADWRGLFTNLFDLLQHFLQFFAKHNQWEFLIDVAQNANPTQKKNMSNTLASFIQNSKVPQVKQFVDVLNGN